MTQPDQLVVTPGTFHHVGGAASMINEYAAAQQKAAARVNQAMGLPGLFDGESGAQTRKQTTEVPQAVLAAGDTTTDLRALFISAENSLAEFVDGDRLGAKLILASQQIMPGDPKTEHPGLYPVDPKDKNGESKAFNEKLNEANQRSQQLARIQAELTRKRLAKLLDGGD